MRNLARCCALLIAALALASEALAEEEDEGERPASEFVRTGFYFGAGGTAAFPDNWDEDFDNDLNRRSTQEANETAQESGLLPDGDDAIPVEVTVDGADLEDTLMGVNAVIGYRAAAPVAFELEFESLIDTNKTSLDVRAVGELRNGDLLESESAASHSAKVEKIWTLTANVKAYPPLNGRFQPFAKVGLGLQHSEVDINVASSGLITTEQDSENLVLPADFRRVKSNTSLDGVLRVGGGIDLYATPNIVAELNAAYVVPFSETGSFRTDFVALQWRLIYRF